MRSKANHSKFISSFTIRINSQFYITVSQTVLDFTLSGMITGGAAATVYYNLKLRHPTLELPIIDYDLALLFQPMLVLGISIGVALNVIFANWMITILLIVLFIGIYKQNLQFSLP